jgi:hypothetical protein
MQEVATTCSLFFYSIYKTFIPLSTTFNSLLDFIKDTTHPHTKISCTVDDEEGGEGLWNQC